MLQTTAEREMEQKIRLMQEEGQRQEEEQKILQLQHEEQINAHVMQLELATICGR